jgi:seryl-tRNA synthetase
LIDIKLLRNEMGKVEKALESRGMPLGELSNFTSLDVRRRQLLQESESLKNRRNTVSQEVAQKKKAGLPADDIIAEMREVGDRIKQLDEEIRELEAELDQILLKLPNLPHESVPVGKSEEDNVEVRRVGEPRQFDFEPLPHWDLAAELDILDFERAAKVAGSRFVFFKGAGARLERALIQFMMDVHADRHGYTEIIPPYIVNRGSLVGTGQLPKFEEDVFRLQGESDLFLIPTAEVPVTNLHANEILAADQLPIHYVAYSGCFRSEAGSAGRDTRGIIRLHQFDKVELIKFTLPEQSYDELEKMTADAETILKLLGLPYRVIVLCTGDMGFSAAKTYDLEVWLPSYGTYREISSCSNTEDFQARRANIRFRREPNAKPEFVHTLNGSGLAVGRTLAAILENYQQADGSVVIPEVLRPYMGGMERIVKK